VCLKDKPKMLACALTALPPNIVQGSGPSEFMQIMNFIMDKCLATPFIHEKRIWVEALEVFFNPHWPESDSLPETFFLKPNVDVFVEQGGGLDKLMQILLESPVLAMNCKTTLSYISRYRGITSTVYEEEETTGSEKSFGQNTSFVFDELSPKICKIIFHEYLHCSNADQLPFGRTSKKGARFICALLEQSATQYCRLTNELELIRQVRSDKTLERSEILHAKAVERGENLNAEQGLADSIKGLQELHAFSVGSENSFTMLLRRFSSQLRTYQILQYTHPASCAPLELLILRCCEYATFFRRHWIKPIEADIESLSANLEEVLGGQQA